MNTDDLIYTTGAYLRPLKVTDQFGEEIWVWRVVEFDQSSFQDGEEVDPNEFLYGRHTVI